ncbi:MAG TPA: ABC transporter permease [Methanosarcinaceae archaeon]|nr:ABC transporter permease [Methanosarcinaceae archaeon]
MAQHNNQFMDVIERFKESRSVTIGATIIVLFCLLAIFAPQLSPNNPTKACLDDRLISPFTEFRYPLGTDHLGRCFLSRLLYGTRISLMVGITVVSISATVGIILGVVSGYYGGLPDALIMRLVDATLAFPSIFLAVAIAGILGQGLVSVMIALVVVDWTKYARVVRGSVLSLKEKEFIESARSLGATDLHIMARHILPNIVAPIIVVATLGMAYVILSAAALSFLGFGPQPPTPEWGVMLNAGRVYMRTEPHLTILPGLAIMAMVLAFNLLGDGLRDILDPKRSVIE